MGKDVMPLGQDVIGIGRKRLLRNCPVCHSKQQSVLLKNEEGGWILEWQGTINKNRAQEELVRLLLADQGFP